MVVLLVDPVTPPVESLEELPPVLGPPMELVLPEVPPLPDGLVLPAVLLDPEPEPMPLPEGLVVLEELVEPVPAPVPAVPSRLLQALSERAATTARVAAAH